MIPIFVEEPITWKKIQVPPSIVQYCKDFTFLDPLKWRSRCEREETGETQTSEGIGRD